MGLAPWLLVLGLSVSAGCAQPPRPTPVAAAAASASAPALTPAISGVVDAKTPIVLIREGFNGTEGPVALPDGSLAFTETQAQRITRIGPDDAITTLASDTNGANGLGFLPNGDLVAVQVVQTRVGIVHPAAHRKSLSEGLDGGAYGRPNDLVVDRQGTVYFTDSGVGPTQKPPVTDRPLRKPAVYRITPDGRTEQIASGITRPNGIQLSPDEKVLYVADTGGEHILAFDLGADGQIRGPRPFARLEGVKTTENGLSSGADGLAVDAEGRLYVASNPGIQVFSPRGVGLGTIPLPRQPQNLAFAGPNKTTLYVVGRGAAYRIATLTPGVKTRAK